jgi:putative DNA primase/helicase
MNQVQIQQEFKGFLIDTIGYAPETILGDSTLHRIKDNKGKLNGAYVLHLDGVPAGYCEDFKQGIKTKWRLKGNDQKLTKEQFAELKIKQRLLQQQREAELKQVHDKAMTKALRVWSRATPVINHSYLTAKNIKPHNAKVYYGALVIPIFNNEVLVSVQFIGENSHKDKRFLTGGKQSGSYTTLGQYDANKPILLCEGWATGASLYEHTENLTYVAFSAHNLKEVAIYVRSLYAKGDIIIMGDNDRSGVGQRVAREAALAISGKYLIPETIGHDWNDVINMGVAA